MTRGGKGKDMLHRGETYIAQLAMVAPKLTEANARMIEEGIRGSLQEEIAISKSFLRIQVLPKKV